MRQTMSFLTRTFRSVLVQSKRLLLTPTSQFKLLPNIIPLTEIWDDLTSHSDVQQDLAKSANQNISPLEPRPMSNSYCQTYIPLGTNTDLRLKYLHFGGFVRFGMLLEAMDAMAVYIAYRHTRGVNNGSDSNVDHRPMNIVTAGVDRIDLGHLQNAISPERDIVMEGYVSYVGKSSLESTMQLLQMDEHQQWHKLCKATFVVVATDPTTGAGMQVHPMTVETTRETENFSRGAAKKKQRQIEENESLLRAPPNRDERHILHQLFLETVDEEISHSYHRRDLPENCLWMEDCRLLNVVLCLPEHRNIYHKIFGGFLMRKAYELAAITGAMISHSWPMAIAVDDIKFHKSVDVGSVLFFSARVSYTNADQMQVRVHTEVFEPVTGDKFTTNIFNFTLGVTHPVVKLMPNSYADAMLYLTGKRTYEKLTHS